MTVNLERYDNQPPGTGQEPFGLGHLLESAPLYEGVHLAVGVAEQPHRGEDRVLADAEQGTFAVVDGMGSHKGAADVAETIRWALEVGLQDKAFDVVKTADEAVDVMCRAFVSARADVAMLLSSNRSLDPEAGAVASAVKVLNIDGRTIGVYGHVGDTRITIRRADGGIEQLTTDECLPPPYAHRVLNAITAKPGIMSLDQFGYVELGVGDRLAILSDGITGDDEEDRLTNAEWTEALAASNAKAAADTFIARSKKVDDKSALVVDIEPYESRPVKGSVRKRATALLGGLAASGVLLAARARSRRPRQQAAGERRKPVDKLRHFSQYASGYMGMAMNRAQSRSTESVTTNERLADDSRRRKVIAGAIGVVAIAAVGYIVYKGIDALTDASPAKAVNSGLQPEDFDAGGPSNENNGAPSGPEIALTTPEVKLPAYDSRTGAGTIEGSALQETQRLGIDTSDLTDLQQERFTNLLRTKTLELNGWSEAQARRLQIGQMVEMLRQVEIERWLEVAKSR